MKYLDLTLPTPAENLAADEALLEWGEATGDECLRFWEPTACFVVVGYADRVALEVNLPACQAAGIPILRRCTGGGTVLQGPGCLNYTLVLQMNRRVELQTLRRTNDFVMARNAAALASLLPGPVTCQGHTDLAVEGRKVSGNAQRRTRQCVLFHGVFLLGLDLARVAAVLRVPARQPAYRQNRPHAEFLRNLNLSSASLKAALARVWEASEAWTPFPIAKLAGLVAQKYSRDAWNFKF